MPATVEVDTRWFQARLADVRLSQRRVAKLLNLDPAAVSLMIRGKRRMQAAEAAELARLMGVSVSEVLAHAGIAAVEYHEGPPAVTVTASPPPPPPTTPTTCEVPVPLADGGLAKLILPRKLNRADAERIAAMVIAFVAVKG